jgi:hypothetical protein
MELNNDWLPHSPHQPSPHPLTGIVDHEILVGQPEPIDHATYLAQQIADWKKRLTKNKVPLVRYTNTLIEELYFKCVQTLFRQFVDLHHCFHDLFDRHICFSYKNNMGGIGSEWLEHEMSRLTDKPSPWITKMGQSAKRRKNKCAYQNMFIQIEFKGYRYHALAPFCLASRLKVEFHHSHYTVHFAGQKMEKNYDICLSPTEREYVMSECLSGLFTELKQKAGS